MFISQNVIFKSFIRVYSKKISEKLLHSSTTKCRSTQIQLKTQEAAPTEKIPDINLRNNLQTLLGISTHQALDLVTLHKKIAKTSTALLARNALICFRNDLDSDVIVTYPFLLCDPQLEEKIKVLKDLKAPLQSVASLVNLHVELLKQLVANQEEFWERVKYLKQKLEISDEEVFKVISNRYFLFTRDVKDLDELFSIYKEIGFSKNELCKDLWIFKYSVGFVQERRNYLRLHKVENVKTWMIRCKEEVLNRHIDREMENKDILGKNSLVQYISKILQCSEDTVENMLKKLPQIESKSLHKINIMIDLLYKAGYTSKEICQVPKVLLHSKDTTEARLKELAALGRPREKLYILTKSQKEYLKFIQNLEVDEPEKSK